MPTANKVRLRGWLALFEGQVFSDRHGVEDVVVLWRLEPDKAARFDLSAYFGEIIIDLLGKDGRLTIRPFSGSYSAEIERRSEALSDLDWSRNAAEGQPN